MAAGGSYNAPSAEDTRAGFGNDTQMDSIVGSGSGSGAGVTNTPLFGDYKKHEDLKGLLDSSKEQSKLEAMRLIVGMVAKGKDCSDLFPAVVKNVVSKNSEIKKLVYVYLVRYAEEQQDLALLSISTFQKALKDPNQLIRASALRVLSSIRVSIIAPIMMLSIKESVNDMSPFVRKTAAHAIPKLYSLDPELKDELIEVIEKLLKDQTTLVAGSVVMAFLTVCPDRIDLIHKNYRKLTNLLVDVDEWGQVMILNLLTRYARTQFIDPNKEELKEAAFYSDEDKSSSESSEEDDEEEDEDTPKKKRKPKKKPYIMDEDHRLLLKNCKPLLQSRNAAVVMAVAQLYHHIAPTNEMGVIVKPLIRLLRGHPEVQSIVLANVATMSTNRANLFEPYLKSFYVHSNDPRNVKLLKLEIIANIAQETSIHTILREFRTYISSSDKVFAAATIQAIGRLACGIADVTETCLHGLMSLLSHKDETVVGESVVVIKKLLQLQPKENKELIKQVARLTDKVSVPMAKASILWLVGEYCSLVPKISPDVLRKTAKSFPDEPDIVKLQTINLAAKLCIANARQARPLCQYVLNMAKYDQNYDIRDRARFLRQLVLPAESTALSKYAKKILLASKPVPVLESAYKGRSHLQLGSLSHTINAEATGYIPLPDFPEEAPDPTVREVEEDSFWAKKPKPSTKDKDKGFYSSEEEEEDDDEGSEFYSSISGSEDQGTEDSEEDSSGSEDEDDEDQEEDDNDDQGTSTEEEDALEKLQKRFGVAPTKKQQVKSSSDYDTSTEDETGESETSTEESSSEDEPPPPKKSPPKAKKAAVTSDLLDLEDWGSSGPAPSVTPSTDILTPLSSGAAPAAKTLEMLSAQVVPDSSHELLNRITGQGLSVNYSFTRKPHIASEKMLAIKLTFSNTQDSPITSISIGESKLQAGMSMKPGSEIAQLAPGASYDMTIGVDFNDTQQPAKFDICVGRKKYPVKIEPLVGELVRPVRMTEEHFNSLQNKLKGMHEVSHKLSSPASGEAASVVMGLANVAQVPCLETGTLKFASVTFATGLPVLLSIEAGSKLVVNSEKMAINSMLLKSLKEAFST